MSEPDDKVTSNHYGVCMRILQIAFYYFISALIALQH